MSKYTGQVNKKQQERDKKKQSGALAAIASIQGQVQKFANEWAEKHNTLNQHVEEIKRLSATEFGKLWGNQQLFADSNEGMDRNVMALAELAKDVFLRLELSDRIVKKLAEKLNISLDDIAPDLEEVKAAATATYKEVVKEAMSAAVETIRKNQEAMAEQRRLAQEEMAKAIEEQKKAEAEALAAAEEAKKAESALRGAEADDVSNIQQAGGAGVDVPEGAQVFGG